MFYKNSFRRRLIFVFLITVFIPIVILGTITYFDIYEYLTFQKNERTLEEIVNSTKLMDAWFDARIASLKSISSSLTFNLEEINDPQTIYHYLYYQRYKNNLGIINLYITTIEGNDYNSNYWRYEDIDEDLRQSDWYIGAKERDGLFISKPYENTIYNEKVITLSLPIKSKSGNFIGVLGADFRLKDIIDEIKTIDISPNTFHIIMDSKNDIIYNNSNINSNLEEFLEAPLQIIEVNHENESFIGVYTHLDSINIGVINLENTKEYYSQINRFFMFFILICVLAGTLSIISILYISKKLSKPVMELKKGMVNILQGNLDAEFKEAHDDDFRELMISFNIMTRTLKDNYKNLAQQSKDLFKKNELLQEINTELEESINNLEITTKELNYSENKYRALIKNIPDIIWVMDKDGEINYINESVKGILGYESHELIGKNIHTIMCSSHKYENCGDIIKEFRKRDFKNYDLWFLKSNEEERIIIETTLNRIFDENNNLISIQGIGRDVTNKRKLERDILKKNRKLEIINEISYSLTEEVKLDGILSTIVNRIHDLLKVEFCSIRLLNEDNLELKAASGEYKDYIKKAPINIYEDVIGKAVLDKKTIIIKDEDNIEITAYKSSDKLFKVISNLKLLVIIPLKIKDECIGVLIIGSQKEIDKSDIDILKAFSSYAAVAIEKATLYEDLKEAYFKTIKSLATAVEAKDSYTEGHSIRVSKYANLIAENIGLDKEKIEEINICGILHDIGKIGISDHILMKTGKLKEEEYIKIKEHPIIGEKILKNAGLPASILNGVMLHHKRFDLKGYPEEIIIDELPLEARIIGVADAFDAMTSNRSYSRVKTIDEAMEELILYKGTQFCPEIVQVMEKIFYKHREKISEISNLKSS